ncbi:hypothetical protein NDU88_006300 [Pleurodeles waltl]|uniref:Uncharacterized protein n=1 Tax=Pleurodeles waltl TaxID=8319 RepID=A0AAV7RM39_PLEWA|nr:hypothetical protein NDU88_006300 [Pleurodeles waltl]
MAAARDLQRDCSARRKNNTRTGIKPAVRVQGPRGCNNPATVRTGTGRTSEDRSSASPRARTTVTGRTAGLLQQGTDSMGTTDATPYRHFKIHKGEHCGVEPGRRVGTDGVGSVEARTLCERCGPWC